MPSYGVKSIMATVINKYAGSRTGGDESDMETFEDGK